MSVEWLGGSLSNESLNWCRAGYLLQSPSCWLTDWRCLFWLFNCRRLTPTAANEWHTNKQCNLERRRTTTWKNGCGFFSAGRHFSSVVSCWHPNQIFFFVDFYFFVLLSQSKRFVESRIIIKDFIFPLAKTATQKIWCHHNCQMFSLWRCRSKV